MQARPHSPNPVAANPEAEAATSRGRLGAAFLPLGKPQDLALSAMLILQCTMLFVAVPLAALGYAVPRYSVDVLAFAFVSLVVVISPRRASALIAIAGAACGLASTPWHQIDPSSTAAVVIHIGSLIGVIVSGGIVAGAIFAPGPVTVHRLVGAVVLYLNAALGFSMVYRLIADVAPDAFASGLAAPGDLHSVVTLIYFSFVTLTSTGFGDIVPVHPIARSVANFEAVIGQLYPATLVAVLVSQHLETRRR